MKSSLLFGAIVTSVVLACSGGGNDAGPQPTATLAPPPVDPRLDVMGRGDLTLTVAASSGQAIDPLALARALGTPPTCAEFVFLFSWRVREGPALHFQGNRQGGLFDIVSGTEGQASVSGCILLEAVNGGDEPAEGDLRYFIARMRP